MERHKVCRYFQRGSCKKQKCPFVHLRENRKNCEFYLQGYCKKGANCNFYHPPKEKQAEKIEKDKYKKELYKKERKDERKQQQKHEQAQHDQHQTNEPHQHQHEYQDQQQHINRNQQKKEQTIKQQHHHQIKQQQPLSVNNQSITTEQKRKTIDFLLGLESQSDSDDDSHQQVVQKEEDIMKPIRKPLNFVKTYPKKFPDYTKTVESKQKILENQKIFFKGVKFTDLLLKTQDAGLKQFYQLVRKYQDSITILEQSNQQQQHPQPFPTSLTLNLRPLLYSPQIMLHFQMIQDAIQFKIHTNNYPSSKKCTFQIMNISIPQEYKEKFIVILDKFHRKNNLVETLKYFGNNFQKIYHQCKTKLENQHYSRIQLQQKIAKKLQQKKHSNSPTTQKPKKQKPQSSSTPPLNPDLIPIHYPQGQKIVVGNMTYELRIQSLHLINIQYVVAQRFLLYIQCQCQKRLIYILEADRKELKIGIKLQCRKCSIGILVAIQREVMQMRSVFVGRMGIENGRLLEIGGIAWKIGCACDKEIVKNRICLPGYRYNINCLDCFKQMQVQYMGLYFHNPFFKEVENIVPDKQLPNKGACKHMKLSFRWIRYGCCGRRWSCDQCHINGSIYQHDKIEGITMICGFCGIEQNIGKQCVHCKRELVRGVDKSGHWQGGLGCRDKTLLSKKDAKKYAGLTKQHHKQK